MARSSKILSLRLQGYRPFRDLTANFETLQILVGANGSGKSSLFEFLRFLRNGCKEDITPNIITGSYSHEIFHSPGIERLWWSLKFDIGVRVPLNYQGELLGPKTNLKMKFEKVETDPQIGGKNQGLVYMRISEEKGEFFDPETRKIVKKEFQRPKPNVLALRLMLDASNKVLYSLRSYIENWRFYSSFNINNTEIRKPVLIEEKPFLAEDAHNLSAVLHFLMTENTSLFIELQDYLKMVIPGFRSLKVPARGAPGEVVTIWNEDTADKELTLADLSDGILRYLCWVVICIHPNPPGLIFIDEPDQGIHPRALSILAGLFERLAEKTQVFLITHSSYFLGQFDVKNIGVFRKVGGEANFFSPSDSKALIDNINEFGKEEIEFMHRSDELELLSGNKI